MPRRYARRKAANRENRIIFLVGPTAVGKTKIAIDLARRLGGEIVSCDSMQLYKGMEVLSQAPTLTQRKRVKHYLVGFLDPCEEYNVARFRRAATRLIGAILKRKKMPVVVGGSGLYIKAIVDGLFPSPPADRRFRKKISLAIRRYGSACMHDRLKSVDSLAASAIHPNDARRIIRALEIYHLTGRTITELKRDTKGLASRYDIPIFGLSASRRELYRRIDARAEEIFECGAVPEVRRLSRKKLGMTARAVLGYKEVLGYANGRQDAFSAKEELKMNTRRFAKRQLTWFRADKRIKWFNVCRMGEGEIVSRIAREIKSPRCRSKGVSDAPILRTTHNARRTTKRRG